MAADVKAVPRYDVKANERVDGFVGMGEMLATSVKHRPTHLMNIIEDVSGVPSFSLNERGEITGEARPAAPAQAEAPQAPVSYKEDCTAGCGQRGTVIPINSTLKDWQCKNCGKQYTIK